MMNLYKVWLKSVGLALLIFAVLSHPASAATKPDLVVAISLDIPPYVMKKASSGLEVEIIRYALKGYNLSFIQIPYEELQTAVAQKRADVSVGVQMAKDEVFYSDDFITFANYAISKKADGLKIDSVSALKNHRVLTWEGAYLELGDEFERLFSPQSPQRKNYIEVADQEEQVRMFWQGKGNILVIDRSIFVYFSKAMGHPMKEVSFYSIFPATTDFKVGFKDSFVRDKFNQGLTRLCNNGGYERLLRRYDVKLENTVCD